MALILDGSLGITPAPTLPNYTLLDTQTFTANGTWTKPNVTGTFVVVRCWGAGGSGRGGAGAQSYGGGGGGFNEQIFLFSELTSTVSVTVGAGGTAATSGNNGTAGGNTSFGSYLTAYGGGGGGDVDGGGGGSSGSAGGTNNGTKGTRIALVEKYIPIIVSGGLTANVGTMSSVAMLPLFSANPKANAGETSEGGDGRTGGPNDTPTWGGGGGGRSASSSTNAGGTSTYGGNGGTGGTTATVTAGIAPAGGGGANHNGTSGAGARGQCIVYVY